MREISYAEALKYPGAFIKVFAPGKMHEKTFYGRVISGPASQFNFSKESSVLCILWTRESAISWGHPEDGLANNSDRRYWLINEQELNDSPPPIPKDMICYWHTEYNQSGTDKEQCSCNASIKSVPLGIGGNCKTINICTNCGEER
jgi:hypothetical protein